MRLPPVGPDHGGHGGRGEAGAPHGCGHGRGDVRQHLPLRHLPANPRGHQACGADAGWRKEGGLSMDRVPRREFLIAGGAGGGGLRRGWHIEGGPRFAAAATTAPPLEFAPNAFIRVGTDGGVTLIMGQVEMGQGMYTSMPMLLAEELEVGLDQVRLEHAPPDDKRYANPLFGFQATGGSTSVKGLYLPMRRAGATARTMLIAAAAGRWNVEPASCRAERGPVIHAGSGRRLGYGALAAAAAELPIPDNVPLKRPEEVKLIGTPANRLQTTPRADGRG